MKKDTSLSSQWNGSRALDSLGIALSMLCIAHCLVLPLVVALLPFALGDQLSQPWVHWVLLATVLPVAVYALYRGYSEHDEALVLVLGAIGLVGLMSAHPSLAPALSRPSLSSSHSARDVSVTTIDTTTPTTKRTTITTLVTTTMLMSARAPTMTPSM